MVYAHRGGAALAPENTIAAFDNGLACGAEGLELDVQLSRDGVVVVHHDLTLERTTDGRGPVGAHPASALAALDAGFHFMSAGRDYPFRGRGVGIPALRDVLRRYADVALIIELKLGGSQLARCVVDEVKAAGAVDRVVIGSFHGDALRTVREYEPRIPTGAAKEETRWALYRSWVGWPSREPAYREFQVPEWSGVNHIVTPRFITHAHRAGVRVKVWTVNQEHDMRRLVEWGVDALITDRPDLARAVVSAHGRR